MVLGWTYAFIDNSGRERGATASRALLNEATYPVQMDEVIDRYEELPEAERAAIDDLFLKRRPDTEEGLEPPVSLPAKVDTPAPPPAASGAGEPDVNARSSVRPVAFVDRGPPASKDSLERFARNGFANGAGSAAEPLQAKRITGRVIRVLDGYGFIQSDVTDATPFFHHSEVHKRGFDHIQPGTPVSFVETQGDRGPVAKDVRLIDDAA